MTAPKILCVVGPTACGKTKMGILLAKKLNGEVVSVDSMQIYRGMTIGTAAPTEEEMEGVPHHMVAVADPGESWSAARYAAAAGPIVDDILARGKLPVLVGGTGLWADAIIRGHGFAGGKAGGEVRKMLQQRLAAEIILPHQGGHHPGHDDRKDHGQTGQQGQGNAETQHHDHRADQRDGRGDHRPGHSLQGRHQHRCRRHPWPHRG